MVEARPFREAGQGSLPPHALGFLKPGQRPTAVRMELAPAAPVHVSSSRPSLARTREIELFVKFVTQRSLPSEPTNCGLEPTVVVSRTASFCGVQK